MIRRPPRSPLFPYTPLSRSTLLGVADERAAPPVLPPLLQARVPHGATGTAHGIGDRKSTRLNSSHVRISYAVFCLKKKKRQSTYPRTSMSAVLTDLPLAATP